MLDFETLFVDSLRKKLLLPNGTHTWQMLRLAFVVHHIRWHCNAVKFIVFASPTVKSSSSLQKHQFSLLKIMYAHFVCDRKIIFQFQFKSSHIECTTLCAAHSLSKTQQNRTKYYVPNQHHTVWIIFYEWRNKRIKLHKQIFSKEKMKIVYFLLMLLWSW